VFGSCWWRCSRWCAGIFGDDGHADGSWGSPPCSDRLPQILASTASWGAFVLGGVWVAEAFRRGRLRALGTPKTLLSAPFAEVFSAPDNGGARHGPPEQRVSADLPIPGRERLGISVYIGRHSSRASEDVHLHRPSLVESVWGCPPTSAVTRRERLGMSAYIGRHSSGASGDIRRPPESWPEAFGDVRLHPHARNRAPGISADIRCGVFARAALPAAHAPEHEPTHCLQRRRPLRKARTRGSWVPSARSLPRRKASATHTPPRTKAPQEAVETRI
jgi:hypothetical protein